MDHTETDKNTHINAHTHSKYHTKHTQINKHTHTHTSEERKLVYLECLDLLDSSGNVQALAHNTIAPLPQWGDVT